MQLYAVRRLSQQKQLHRQPELLPCLHMQTLALTRLSTLQKQCLHFKSNACVLQKLVPDCHGRTESCTR